MQFGYAEGEVCKRNNCQGVIADGERRGCSCHISPPCRSCTEDVSFCPGCGWRGKDDEYMNDFRMTVNPETKVVTSYERRKLDATKIDWHSKSHTNSSMIKEGVYPDGTSRSEVEKAVIGTFGGRFESFGGGRFKYVAYTD